ncbi:MAG TPA: SDR family oxidoreductase [Alphaproteobacteria bacterium]|nr:SDR family oxidoreductase [Alphaproteobacteria bacterium]
MRLKRVEDQVVVITGATSGIGLVTARMAAARGAGVVLAARDGDALGKVEREIAQAGGNAVPVAADVANEGDMRRVADAAIRRFGRFDTWVNNAGVSIYGRIAEVPIEDQRRLFETNYWGVVIGSRIAVEHLRRRGGALINIGSVLSDQAFPLQGPYSASKHAVKGFTDALRMELEEEGAPVSVTLVKPAAIDTMFEEHARNYLEVEPQNPPPVYAPELVAEAILHAAEHRVRDLVVGGGGKAMSMMGRFAPRLGDRVMERTMVRLQRTDRSAGDRADGLYGASGADGRESAGRHGYVRRHSFYTRSAMHPLATMAVVAGLGALAAALARGGPHRIGAGPAGPAGRADGGTGYPAAADVLGHGGPPVGVLGVQGPDDPLEDRYGAGAME